MASIEAEAGVMDTTGLRIVNDDDRRPFFTPKTLAQYLAVSERTVRDMLAKGRIPSYKVEGQRRVSADDVDQYLARNRQEAA